MKIDPTYGLNVRPVECYASSCGWMREQFHNRAITLRPSSSLARGLAGLERFRERVVIDDGEQFDTAERCYDFAADIYGAEFLTKSLHWGTTSGLHLDNRRWEILGKGNPIITRSGPESTKDRNETWEIVIAGLAATFATDVCFAEPDIICTYEGKRYGIAAKVSYSEDKLFENILKGIRQARGKFDVRLVFVNIVSLYPQVMTLRWSHCRNFQHNDEAVSVMTSSVTRWCDRWSVHSWAKRLRTESSEPFGVAFFVPIIIHLAGAPRPFWYTHMPLTWSGDGPDYRFAQSFLRRCNEVLSFEPGYEARLI